MSTATRASLRHTRAREAARTEAAAASDAQLAAKLREAADDLEGDGRARLPWWLREAADRIGGRS